MTYDELEPGDSIIDSNKEVWTLITHRDELGYAIWMCMTDFHRVDLCMRGEIPIHYKVCLVPREGK